MRFSFIFLSFIFLLLNSCKKNESAVSQTFEKVENSGLDFENIVKETKDFNIFTYRNFYNGGGVGVGDINNDGLPDVYFTSNQNKNKLYLNKGNFEFEDITEKAGVGGTKAWSTGVTMVDINADGFLDIYVCNSGDIKGDNKENELFINNGNLTFTEKAKEYNLSNQGYSTHAAFFDYDTDGDLDCYILNNSFKNPDKIELYKSMRDIPDALGGDKLMRNDGPVNKPGTNHPVFTDVTSAAGIYSSAIGFGLGVATGDVNDDNLPDLYISNDFFERDYLHLNQGNGTFKEDLINRIDHTSVSSMGADIADINGDGFPEIFTTDMLAADNDRIKRVIGFDPYHLEDYKYRANYHYQLIQNCLQLNSGKGYFQEIANFAGVAATDWSWGALVFDFENDGKNDIFVSNGIFKDIMDGDFREFSEQEKLTTDATGGGYDFTKYSDKIPITPLANWAFVNNGELQFQNQAEPLGLGEKTFSNGSVYVDLDQDGDLDLLLNNVNQKCSVYRNTSSNNYLKVKLVGDSENRFGIGAKVKLRTNESLQVKENYTNRGFQSSIEPSLVFGLGEIGYVTELEVIWPNGKAQVLKNIKPNQTLLLEQKNAKDSPKTIVVSKSEEFKEINLEEILPGAVHHENVFNDFNQEPLLLGMLSTQGPEILKKDVNGDKLEDILLLGAKGDPDKMYIQTSSGKFLPSNKSTFERDKNFESTCAAFLDFDKDGDQDLLIGSGSNEILDQINYIVRLYMNDGKGNFMVDPSRIPPIIGNFSTIAVSDYNHDGFEDVFIGARAVPGNYGLKPQSYLLQNNGGQWMDVTPEALSNIGMVTDAKWGDMNGDNWDDLVLLGDWMPVQIFNNKNGNIDKSEILENCEGWWQKLDLADLDNDGDLEIIGGNWGQNSKLQASQTYPLSMQVGDFDKNNKSEFIINWKAPLDNKTFPFATKIELTSQVPSLKAKALKYSAFAPMQYKDFFPDYGESDPLNYKATELRSGVFWNDAGRFTFKPFGVQAQFAPIFGICIFDINGDKFQDIVIGGNMFALKPQVGRLNASRGLVLKNNTKQSFSVVSKSGFYVDGEIRSMVNIENKLFVARNNQACKVFRF
jgi:hypothetical protein